MATDQVYKITALVDQPVNIEQRGYPTDTLQVRPCNTQSHDVHVM